jgi:monofunctional biosynthetic peptidoglycan transglycosylase
MARRGWLGRTFRRLARAAALGLGLWLLASAALVAPWRWIDPPTSAFMLRERIATGHAVRHHWLPLRQISPQLAIAVVAAEDQRFPAHGGFDFEAIQKALTESGGRPRRGASTITQQVAKNLFLWPGRSFVRKGLEAWLTLCIEALWPKRRILEVYLNVAEFGRGVFGAGAASEIFFGQPARELTLAQASLLAAALPTPKRSSVAKPSEYLLRRAEQIEAAARRLGGSGYLARL